MPSMYQKTHVIFCKDCGSPRTVYGPNYGTVKRCEKCQYKQKRIYNSSYIKKKREERKAARLAEQKHAEQVHL